MGSHPKYEINQEFEVLKINKLLRNIKYVKNMMRFTNVGNFSFFTVTFLIRRLPNQRYFLFTKMDFKSYNIKSFLTGYNLD